MAPPAGSNADIVAAYLDESESKNIATILTRASRLSWRRDLIYNDTHCYLQERHLDSWQRRLTELERFVASGVTTV